MFKNFMFLLSLSLVFYSCTKPCENTNCLNDGVCVDGDCICPEGFYGVNCELSDNNSNEENLNVNGSCESDFITYNNYTYDIVDVNGKCWFAENLRSTSFNNGDDLQEETVILNWSITNSNLNYVNTWSYTPIEGENGLLYSGNIVVDERNVCPVGWHVSTDEDWMDMESFIGVPEDELYLPLTNRAVGYRDIIASQDFYGLDSLGLNFKSTGFMDGCDPAEFHDGIPLWSMYWTSSHWEDTELLLYRNLTDIYNNSIAKGKMGQSNGYAIRCVKD